MRGINLLISGIGKTFIVLGLLLVVFSGCQAEESGVIATSASEVADDPEEYIGNVVTVSGEVDRVWGPQTFAMGGDEFEDNLLVISADPLGAVPGRTDSAPLVRNDIVQVTGVVQLFSVPELETEYGLDLDPELEVEFESQPVLIASSSASVLSNIVVTPRATAGLQETPVTDIASLSTMEDATNRLAVFSDAQIMDVVNDNMMWIGSDPNSRVFVLVPDLGLPAPPIEGQNWQLHGVLREIPDPGTLRTEWNLDEETISALQDQNVYLHAVRAEQL